MKETNIENLKAKVTACWLGKAVGGTLGMPWEGRDELPNLTFYNPVPADMLPNDDLDLQVVWACVLNKMDKPNVNKFVLGKAWLDHVDFPMDEYGVAHRNMLEGIQPPLSGKFDNWFIHGMGAAIRSEIWACLAAGNIPLAAAYAYEDACVDHYGEGIWAEVFLASLQAGAFVESNPEILLKTATAQLPETSLVRQAAEDTFRWWNQSKNWRAIREQILDNYGHENFTDVTMNMAFIVLGWLAGEGDFSKAICTAVNCGKDTDCTGATVGALMGIINPDGIDERWLKPIGRSLILSKEIFGLNAPNTIDAFTEMVINLRSRLNGEYPSQQQAQTQTMPDGFNIQWAPLNIVFGTLTDKMPQINENDFETINVPGTAVKFPCDKIESQTVSLRFKIKAPETKQYRIMFNTPQPCRVWVDGKFAFARAAGVMAPSFHRVPPHQFANMDLKEGIHEITAIIAKPADNTHIEWVVGLGDCKSRHWIPNAFKL